MEQHAGPIALSPQIHVGVVVRNLDKTIKCLSSTFGVGPWDIRERHYSKEQVEVGRGPFAYKVAFAVMGSIELDLIEVLEGSTIHAEFLSTKGEGLHHIGFRVPDVNQVVDTLAQRGIGVLQSAFREGARYAHMDPAEFGGITFEFVQRTDP
ncbi:MAG: VOC family protein [Chloroflexota bacterium]